MTTESDFSLMPSPGEVIAGRYEITSLIGRGGGGVVYRATQLGINRDVAVKVLPPEHQLHTAAVRRFEREARLVSRLRHPNTVTLYEYNRTQSGLLYIVMEFVDGVPLKDVLAQHGHIPPARAVPVLRQILKSLAEAHSHGIVHRDLKPANIMLCSMYGEPDFVKVLDFGVATALEGDESKFDEDVTRTADVVGTPKYMAPEQFRSETLTPASDLYALACIAFEMLAGFCPFDGETLHVTIAKHLFQPAPKLPVGLERFSILVGVIEQLLSKQPGQRPQRAEDVLEILENWDGVPGDRTIKAPSPMELMSYVAQHQQRQQGGAFDPGEQTGPVPPGGLPPGLGRTPPGLPSNQTPSRPQYARSPNPSTPHGMMLPEAPVRGAERGKIVLAALIGVAALAALVVFFVIRSGGDGDEHATAEASPSSTAAELPTPDPDAQPAPSPFLSADELERSLTLHDLVDRMRKTVNTATIAGMLRTTGADAASPQPPDAAADDEPSSTRSQSSSESFRVRYSPVAANVKIDGARGRCSDGKCNLKGKIGSPVTLTVRAMGFAPLRKTVTIERGMRNVELELEPMR